jgi:acetate CoA/acetoacetate CoA-transferase alpha subunit
VDKISTAEQAVSHVKNGDVIFVGGFLTAGSPETLIKALHLSGTAKDLTVVSNDTGMAHTNMIKFMETGRVIKIYVSYIGANQLSGQMLINDSSSVILVPQGTLAEKIRCGGAGIPAFYTAVGVGTVIERGKEKRFFDDKEFLLETALRADVAFVKATVADKFGNLYMRGSTKNFGALMARAAEYVVAEASNIVEVGELDSELITVPGIFIDAIVQSEDVQDGY